MKQYMLTDGMGHYIRRDRETGRHVPISRMAYGYRWQSFDAAERVRKCSLGKGLKHRYYTIVIESDDPPVSREDRDAKPQENTVLPEYMDELSKALCEANIEADIIEALKCVEQIISGKEELSSMLSNVDKEVTDLQHYIEKKNLNARDGYKAYKKLQDALIRRRIIKDRQIVLTIIEECKMQPDSIANAISRLKGLSGRKYAPRVLTELFDKGAV